MADELVSNAIQHSKSGEPSGTFRLRLTNRPGMSVRVEVADVDGRCVRLDGESCADAENSEGADCASSARWPSRGACTEMRPTAR